jgi:hypothetical protein
MKEPKFTQKKLSPFLNEGISQALEKGGLADKNINLEILLRDENNIFLRIENLDDLYDSVSGEVPSTTVNIIGLIENLYDVMNP